MLESVPIVDVSSWMEQPPCSMSEISSAQQKVIDDWRTAFTTTGFAIITGTGVDTQMMETLKRESEDFFSQSHEHKMEYNHGSYGHQNGGYSPFFIETVSQSMSNSGSQQPDPVENFVFRDHPLNFASKNGLTSPIAAAHSYYTTMDGLLAVLHQITSISLGLNDFDYINKYYNGKNGNALRLSHYMASLSTASPEDKSRSTLYGAHTDYQGFTILRPDDSDWDDTTGAGGLQVFSEKENDWINVKIPDELKHDAFVVNSGDLIERWTNKWFKSTLHRVLGPIRNSASSASRLSIVFFTGPRHDAVIEVLPGMPGEAGQFAPVTAGEVLTHYHSHLLTHLLPHAVPYEQVNKNKCIRNENKLYLI